MRLLFGFWLVLVSLVASITRYSDADFIVQKDITGNAFRAATLDFTSRNAASGEATQNLFQLPLLKPGGVDIEIVRLLNEGTANPPLWAKAAVRGDQSEFCQALELAVRKDWQEVYRGSLADFQLVLNTAVGQEDLVFILSLPKDADGSSGHCLFDIIFETKKEGTGGFFARRILANFAAN